jgi:phospholipid transport system substrate-binding protein
VSFRQRYDMIGPIVTRTFDLDAILRQAVGPRWVSLSSGEQTALVDAFTRFTIASHVANFSGYSGERLEVALVVRAVASDRIVKARISMLSGKIQSLDYLMRQEGGAWKVVDVLVEGVISRVAAQRSELRSVLADGGGAGLLVGLRQKTSELSGGILQ